MKRLLFYCALFLTFSMMGANPAFQTLTNLTGKTWFVATNGNNGNDGRFPGTPFATVSNALRMVVAGDTIMVGPGQYNIGTNQIILPLGVNLKGAGMDVTEFLGDADCSGVEMGRPTGGPQVCARGNNVVEGFTITCDTNSLWTGFNGGIASPVTTHSGTWSAFGVSALNVPANYGLTNVLVRNVKGRRGYFDVFHFNSSNRVSVVFENCVGESDGGDVFNTVSSTADLESESSLIIARNCRFSTIGNTLYDAYVNGSDPGMAAGNTRIVFGTKPVVLESCFGVVSAGSSLTVTPNLHGGESTNALVVIGGIYTGGSETFGRPSDLATSGFTIWNGKVSSSLLNPDANYIGLSTNYSSTTFTATAGLGKLAMSNNILYLITTTAITKIAP